MDKAWTPLGVLFGGLLTVTGCVTTGTLGDQNDSPPCAMSTALTPPAAQIPPDPQSLPAIPATSPDDRPLPINLPAALQLANVQAVDIAAAAERIRVAASLLEQAQVLWLPTITVGGDFNRHDGRNQDALGSVFDNSRSSGMLGLGTGIGPAAVIDVGEAILPTGGPAASTPDKQIVRQPNDILCVGATPISLCSKLRGAGRSGCHDPAWTSLSAVLVGSAVVPEFEIDAEAELRGVSKPSFPLVSAGRWRAELMRLLRMDPSAQVEPLEPPHLRVELIDRTSRSTI